MLMYGSQWGTLAALADYKKNRNFLLQVTQESVSGTTSYIRATEHAMKLRICITTLSP